MTSSAGGPPDVFRVLYVCTGNICRSPFAQFHTRFLLEARMGPWSRLFSVHSAGTSAVRGHGMHHDSRTQLRSRADHPDVAGFAARQLPDRDVLLADLVLTMTREQRSSVLGDVPKALPTTFTVREFARLLRAAPAEGLRTLPTHPVSRARAMVTLAREARGSVPAVSADEDAVPDPISGGPEAHGESATAIDEAVRTVLDLLVPPRPAPSPPAGGMPGPAGTPSPPAPRSGEATPAPRSGSGAREAVRSPDLASAPGH